MQPPKNCVSCGRTIEWRKKWERNWDQIRFCSNKCRSRKVRQIDRDLEAAILNIIDTRSRDASLCPSAAAKAVAEERGLNDWRRLIEPARSAARRLVQRDLVEITQQGSVVDPSTAKGPIRIRTRRP